MKVKLKIAGIAGLAVLGVGAVWLIRNRHLFTQCDVTTGDSPNYPDLRAHVYFGSPDDIRHGAETSIRSMPHWRHVATSESGDEIYAEAENPLTGMLSDVFVTLEPLGPRHIRVVVRSKSRVNLPTGDMGDNARFIRQLQGSMDGLLTGG